MERTTEEYKVEGFEAMIPGPKTIVGTHGGDRDQVGDRDDRRVDREARNWSSNQDRDQQVNRRGDGEP